MTTIIFASTEATPLYHRYDGQIKCQSAYVEIDMEDDTITADWNDEIGNGIPTSGYHGRVFRCPVSPYISNEGLIELLNTIKPLVEKMAQGFEIMWDGSNHVGTLNNDAREAYETVIYLCRKTINCEIHDVWTATDFLVGQRNYDTVITEALEEHDNDIDSLIDELQDVAEMENIRLVEIDELATTLERFVEEK